jgi:hypothetical protein
MAERTWHMVTKAERTARRGGHRHTGGGNMAGLGGNGPQCTIDQPLHENLDAVAGNGELTSEACGTAEDDGVECED